MTRPPQHLERAAQARGRTPLHPRVSAAADGHLPEWAVVGPPRREHVARVAALLDTWAEESGLSDEDRQRWRAVGYLHDSLRDAPPASLEPLVDPDLGELSASLLHGPAAARRLRDEGVADEELLGAVAFHTLGDPSLGPMGRALYAADFLEPGRTFHVEGRAELCALAPTDLDRVVTEVARARIGHLVRKGMRLHDRTVAFWNALVSGQT